MHPSSTPPPRRSSRARQPRATFIICVVKAPAPFNPSRRSLVGPIGTRPPESRRRRLARWSSSMRAGGAAPPHCRGGRRPFRPTRVVARAPRTVPRDERGRTLRPIDARGDEGSDRTHFSGREFAVLSADLQDSFVVPAPLLLTRIAQGRLDPDADVEVLDDGEVLEPTDRLHGEG